MTLQDDLLDPDRDSAIDVSRKVRLSNQEEERLLSELTGEPQSKLKNKQAIPDDLDSSPQPVSEIESR